MAGQKTNQLPDGVHLGLPEDPYFDQACLGSTDLALLWEHREGWWWRSRYNPRHKRTQTAAMGFGKALHCRLLEGREAFDQRFAPLPDRAAFVDLVDTTEEMLSALEAAEAPKPSTKSRKADLVEMMQLYIPERPVWSVIMAEAQRRAGQRELLTAEEMENIELMWQTAHEEENLLSVLEAEGGERLTEVSVFWTLSDGTRMRYRFDAIVPDGNIDLKAVGNAQGDLETEAGKRIANDNLDVQMALSFEARRRMYDAIEAKQIYGGTKAQRAWLRRFPKGAPLDAGDRPGWSWLWVFYQKPDSVQGRAPTVLPVRTDFAEPLHLQGWTKVLTALRRYRAGRDRFGLDKPWTRLIPTRLTHPASATPLHIPPWGQPAMHEPEAEEAMKWSST